MPTPYRIAAIVSRWPYPPVAGRERMLLQHLGALAAQGTLTIFSVEPPGERPAFLEGVEVVPVPRSTLARAVWRALTRGIPFQEAYYSSDRGARMVAARHVRDGFDTLYVDMIRMAGLSRCLPDADRPRIVLDYDDRLSRRYDDMARIRGASLMGARGADFPPLVHYLSRFVARIVLGAEAGRMRRRERFWSSRADYLLFSSRIEAADFARDTGLDTVEGVPLLPAETPPPAPDDLSAVRLLFVGNLRHTQNVEAFRAVVDHMAARHSAGRPLRTLHVYGRYDPMQLPPGVAPFVQFHGFADTLAGVAAEPGVLVAPITFGTGIKTKVFDCMAVGIPVVTTPRGIEGLDVTPGVECAIVTDAGAAYDEACVIAADPARFLRMRDASAAFIGRFHHDDAAAAVYRRALGIA